MVFLRKKKKYPVRMAMFAKTPKKTPQEKKVKIMFQMVCIPAIFYLLMPNNGLCEKKKNLIFIGTCGAPHFFYQLSRKDQHKICDKI